MNGKGDSPRPLSVDSETFANNWERIFNRNKALDELTRYQEELGLYDDPSARSEADSSEHPRMDEDGNRIEREAC